MKTFKQYNESKEDKSIRDLMKPKSDKEIEKRLKGLSDMNKVYHILKFNIPHKYLPMGENKIKNRLINHIGKIF